jgi:hypothetical protein
VQEGEEKGPCVDQKQAGGYIVKITFEIDDGDVQILRASIKEGIKYHREGVLHASPSYQVNHAVQLRVLLAMRKGLNRAIKRRGVKIGSVR